MKKASRFRKVGCLTCSESELARRDFLRVGSLGFLGLSLSQVLELESLENRRSFLDIVDRIYREKVEEAEFSKMDSFREKALQMILSPKVREAFDLSRESDKTKEAYGRHKFGQSVLLARRLIEAGSRFVTANGYSHNVWDTHGNNDVRHRDKLVPPLDQDLSALLEDLEQRGGVPAIQRLYEDQAGRSIENTSTTRT